ncbi:hypothetical protein BCR36DRAFT_287412, partial [Piromyces finnis]
MLKKSYILNILILINLFKNAYALKYYDSNNSMVVNIINIYSNLCLTYHSKDSIVKLSDCSSKNLKQQWIVPKSGNGSYISQYDTDICLFSGNPYMTTNDCSKYFTKMGDIKNSYGGEAIWSILDDKKCLGISNDYLSLIYD